VAREPCCRAFDDRRQLAELELVAGSLSAATVLAQNYVEMPLG
jgi:p-hydroxybenzoate 3-monooxygenase